MRQTAERRGKRMRALPLLGKAALAAALTMAEPLCAEAGIGEEMNRMFGDMTNVSEPGVYETQRRGVIAGGSVRNRSKIMTENPVSLTLPSVRAGCGGIDLFGGSLSFINGDQFIELLRSIASNAKGYAFQIALSSMCEKCSQYMETLQKKVQALNQYFGNSCQLAQGAVNDTLSAFGQKGLTDASLLSAAEGTADLFTSWSSADGTSPYRKAAKSPAASKADGKIFGNILWKSLRKSGAADWFTGGDTELLEEIMSITGTVIVSDSGGDEPDVAELPGGLIGIEDLLFGGTVSVYRCDSADECLRPSLTSRKTGGLAVRIRKVLTGDGKGPGLIAKFAENSGTVTGAEKAVMGISPAFGSMIRNLSALSPDSAVSFAYEAAPFLALHETQRLMRSLLRAASAAAASGGNAWSGRVQEKIAGSRDEIADEYRALSERYGSEAELFGKYTAIMQALRHEDYLPDEGAARGGNGAQRRKAE